MAVNTDPTPQGELPEAVESTATPPIVHEPVVAAPEATPGKEVEIARIPTPVMTGGRLVFPNAYGVDYTVDEEVVRGAMPHTKDLKVVAVARPGYRFAKGLTRTFNLKAPKK